jgi:hypothetical protein
MNIADSSMGRYQLERTVAILLKAFWKRWNDTPPSHFLGGVQRTCCDDLGSEDS